LVAYLAHDAPVLYHWPITEHGTATELLHSGHNPHTKTLIAALPMMTKAERRPIIRLQGDMPSPVALHGLAAISILAARGPLPSDRHQTIQGGHGCPINAIGFKS
jgi:ABC-type dipeptide/oligopeptide/nickel transport system ATPase component